MRRDEVVPGAGRGPDGPGPQRCRAGRAGVRPWSRGRTAWLVAAASGRAWLPALAAPPGDLPMRRDPGPSRVPICRLAFSPDGGTIATADERGCVRLRPVDEGRGIERDVD